MGDHAAALAALAAAGHPHIRRLRGLCDDDPAVDPATRAAYRALVVGMAAGAVAAPPAAGAAGPTRAELAARVAALRRTRARAGTCPYRGTCGCFAAQCHHLGRLVTVADCNACLDAVGYPK